MSTIFLGQRVKLKIESFIKIFKNLWISDLMDPKSAYLYCASLKPSRFWKHVFCTLCKHNTTDNIKSNTVIHIVIPSVHAANTKWSQIRERLPFTDSNYLHSWGFLTISQKWDESLFLKSQRIFLKKCVTHTSRRTVTDWDLSVKAGFQFIWEFYSIIQQALDSTRQAKSHECLFQSSAESHSFLFVRQQW